MKKIIGVHDRAGWWWAISRVSRLRRKCWTAVEALAHYNAAIRLRMTAEQFHKFESLRNNVWRLRPHPPRGRVHDVRVIDIDDRHYALVDEPIYDFYRDVCWFVRACEILAIERAEKLSQPPWITFHYVRLPDLVQWGTNWAQHPRMAARRDWRDCRVNNLYVAQHYGLREPINPFVFENSSCGRETTEAFASGDANARKLSDAAREGATRGSPAEPFP